MKIWKRVASKCKIVIAMLIYFNSYDGKLLLWSQLLWPLQILCQWQLLWGSHFKATITKWQLFPSIKFFAMIEIILLDCNYCHHCKYSDYHIIVTIAIIAKIIIILAITILWKSNKYCNHEFLDNKIFWHIDSRQIHNYCEYCS